MTMRRIVYFLQREDGDIKIGATTDFRFQTRLRDITLHHGRLKLLGVVDGYFQLERSLHRTFTDHRRRTKDRRYGYYHNTEWFAPAPELLTFIAENAQPLDRQSHPRRKHLLLDEE